MLRQLLTGEGCLDQTFGRPLAVRLRGVSVIGRLNLGGRTARCPLELYGCYLGGRLDLAKAEASDISLRGSHLAQRLSARRLRLTNDLNLTGGFRCHGRVDLRDGHVGGSLKCRGATLSNPGGRALTADRLTVDGSLLLGSAKVTGEVRRSAPTSAASSPAGCDVEQPRRPGAERRPAYCRREPVPARRQGDR